MKSGLDATPLFLQVDMLSYIYLPKCWVVLSSNSRVNIDFFLFQNKKKLTIILLTQVNSVLGQINVTLFFNVIDSQAKEICDFAECSF